MGDFDFLLRLGLLDFLRGDLDLDLDGDLFFTGDLLLTGDLVLFTGDLDLLFAGDRDLLLAGDLDLLLAGDLDFLLAGDLDRFFLGDLDLDLDCLLDREVDRLRTTGDLDRDRFLLTGDFDVAGDIGDRDRFRSWRELLWSELAAGDTLRLHFFLEAVGGEPSRRYLSSTDGDGDRDLARDFFFEGGGLNFGSTASCINLSLYLSTL